jgi:hypothetical protein
MWFTKRRHGRSIGFSAIHSAIKRERMRALTIIETGTLRCDRSEHIAGDGWSTIFFRTMIDSYGGALYSVDIDSKHIDTSKSVVEREFGNLRNTYHCCQDSVSFLRAFDKPIDILYLDSLDYAGDDRAAKHQLAEIEAAFDKLSPRSIVLLDDICETIAHGKAALTIPFLEARGWKCTLLPVKERKQQQWYQAILRAASLQ